MANIEYVDTHHNCWCGFCGAKFVVNIGDIYHSNTLPHRLKVTCPSCSKIRQIEAFVPRQKGAYPTTVATMVDFDVFIPETHEAHPASTEKLLSEMRIMSRHLFALQKVARNAVEFWKDEWSKSCMPVPMEELEKTLKEVQVCDPDEYRQ